MNLRRALVLGPCALLCTPLPEASRTASGDLLSPLGGELRQSIRDLEQNAEQEIGPGSLESGQSHEASETREPVNTLALGLHHRASVAQRPRAATGR